MIAFAPALKIARQSKAESEIVHVAPHEIGSDRDIHWSESCAARIAGIGRTSERVGAVVSLNYDRNCAALLNQFQSNGHGDENNNYPFKDFHPAIFRTRVSNKNKPNDRDRTSHQGGTDFAENQRSFPAEKVSGGSKGDQLNEIAVDKITLERELPFIHLIQDGRADDPKRQE